MFEDLTKNGEMLFIDRREPDDLFKVTSVVNGADVADAVEARLQDVAGVKWPQVVSFSDAASCAIFLAANFDSGVDDRVIGFKLLKPTIHYKSWASLWVGRRYRSGLSG